MNSSSKLPRILHAAVLGLILASVGGCYLVESAQGQLSLMSKRTPIARVLQNPATPPALRARLEEVTAIRDFASHELGLPENGSYRSYADVGRPYVVWNVVAAPEFSVDARQWCYPIVGCVAYRGYFALPRARAFADRLRREGFDVSLGGVAAYSTLGHFDDPVLNTMLAWNDVELAAIIFHELTHQLLYLSSDASFDEALATTVEEEGVRRWLVAQGRTAELEEHRQQQDRYLQVVSLLRLARADLAAIYASGADAVVMRRRKQERIDRLRAAYAALTAGWGGHAPFESWFEGNRAGSVAGKVAVSINNAHLASIATYYDCVPGFERELEAEGGDLERFYRRVFALAKLDQAARDAAVCGPGGDLGT